jgi:hypothetical protein
MLAMITPVLAAMNQTVTPGRRDGAVDVSAMADSLMGRRLCRNRRPCNGKTEAREEGLPVDT